MELLAAEHLKFSEGHRKLMERLAPRKDGSTGPSGEGPETS